MADHDTHDHTGVPGVGSDDLDAILTASAGEDIADALTGAAAPDAGNVFATMADVGGGGNPILAILHYLPSGSFSATVTSTSVVDVDASNMLVTFTAPASGNVLVHVEAFLQNPTWTDDIRLALRESTTVVAGPERMLLANVNNVIGRFTTTFYITGISAGSHTYKLGTSVTGATGFIYWGTTPGASVVMIVTAAP